MTPNGPTAFPFLLKKPGIGLFSGGQAVGVGWSKVKVSSPVMEGDAGIGDNHAGTEALVVALDIGDHIAVAVGGAEIDGPSAGGVARLGHSGGIGYGPLPGVGVGGGQQAFHRLAHGGRIGDILLSVGKG